MSKIGRKLDKLGLFFDRTFIARFESRYKEVVIRLLHYRDGRAIIKLYVPMYGDQVSIVDIFDGQWLAHKNTATDVAELIEEHFKIKVGEPLVIAIQRLQMGQTLTVDKTGHMDITNH